MASLRLCLAVEATARAGPLWQKLSRSCIEPLLAMLEAAAALQAVELALVLFGAHPPHSLAAVESSLGWVASVPQFRALLGGLQFSGGGGQPVALAEALAEAAALFALQRPAAAAAPGAACQQHCLAKLPGLATSAELCGALRRRGVQLGLAADNIYNQQLLWHAANLINDTPISLEEAEQQRRQRGDVLKRVVHVTLMLPGGGMAALPFWPQAAEALRKAGAMPVQATGDLARIGEGLEPVSAPDTEDAATRVARGGTAAAGAAAGLPPSKPSPVETPQWTPPAAAGATPPGTAGTPPSSFWEVLNAEITSPELADAAAAAPTPAALQQPLPGYQQEPAVAGLPLPPGQQLAVPRPGSGSFGGAAYAVIHAAKVVVDPKVMGGGTLLLGVGQVLGMAQDAPTLRALAWPPELHIAKTLARSTAQNFLASKSCWQTRLKIQCASPEAQRFIESLLERNAAGVVYLYSGLTGVLLPARHPGTQNVLLQLLLVRNVQA